LLISIAANRSPAFVTNVSACNIVVTFCTIHKATNPFLHFFSFLVWLGLYMSFF
jgi:hypothetical protein